MNKGMQGTLKKIGIAFLLIASTGVFIAYLDYRADFMALQDLTSKESDEWKKIENNKDTLPNINLEIKK
ncbi:MAG TPA: hypothetical protein VLG49_03195 [Rhabdochlamydiaceae bacterium]|nr:hypothetical protein [Rhabdochlamydiaceae bacterium]